MSVLVGEARVALYHGLYFYAYSIGALDDSLYFGATLALFEGHNGTDFVQAAFICPSLKSVDCHFASFRTSRRHGGQLTMATAHRELLV